MSTTFQTLNPATEKVLETYSYISNEEIGHRIDETHSAWQQWRNSSFSERARHLRRLAEILREEKTTLGHLITSEMGKPLEQSVAEIEKCAWVCEYYAENSEKFLQSQHIKTDASESYIAYAPMGVVFAIMPWNFPFWQVFRFLAPALMAGNAGILKHAPGTTGCGLKIAELTRKAGFPKKLFQTIAIDIPQVEQVISNPKITGVTLTGSTKAGRSVAALAGKYLKKTVLELGGSDPYVILDDADLDLAANECVAGRFLNTGQSCIAAKRFIVTEKNHDSFTQKVLHLIQEKGFGDPLNSPSLGSMARSDLRDQLHHQVTKSIIAGAECLTGGFIPETTGNFYPATLLTQVRKGMPAFDEELFGPVAVIIEAKDEEEAIALANDTEYGLGSAVFSQDTRKARDIAEYQLAAGSSFVNTFVKSDPRLPFGGIKSSGYGRELSLIGITEFVNIKTIYIK